MRTRRPGELGDRALLSIYLRPEAYYIARSDRSTAGLWLGRLERPVVLERELSVDVLGARVFELLVQPADVVPHPQQHEWLDRERAFKAPILAAARRRSWRAFVSGAELVQVSREGEFVTVVSTRRDGRRTDVFVPQTRVELAAPSADGLGETVAAAFR